MIKKLCSYPGCHKVVEAGVKYCDKHRETDRKKYREYKQRRMRDEQEARRQQFYNSKAWEQFRAAQAAAQLGIDIYEYYTTGRIIDAENYHHIQEITEAWARSVVKAALLEVSPCTFPAYDSSEISCRSFEKVKEEAKEEKRLEKLKMEARLMQLREENEKEF